MCIYIYIYIYICMCVCVYVSNYVRVLNAETVSKSFIVIVLFGCNIYSVFRV